MSICVKCRDEMHPAEAADSLICGRCKAGKRLAPAHKVPTLYDPGAGRRGRRAFGHLELDPLVRPGCPRELLAPLEHDDDEEDLVRWPCVSGDHGQALLRNYLRQRDKQIRIRIQELEEEEWKKEGELERERRVADALRKKRNESTRRSRARTKERGETLRESAYREEWERNRTPRPQTGLDVIALACNPYVSMLTSALSQAPGYYADDDGNVYWRG